MDICKYVDPFYGNFEPKLPEPDETSSKWFFLKAQVGNTLPNAVRPFGMVSACVYTGGYPTGYSPYLPSSYARPQRLLEENNFSGLGFSHFHHSGTGDIGDFYNYSIITPIRGTFHERFARFKITNETAHPGFYGCNFDDIECMVSVTECSAVYSFDFPDKNNSIVFDPILNGIFREKGKMSADLGRVLSKEILAQGINTSVKFDNGLILHTAVRCDNCVYIKEETDGRILLKINDQRAVVKIGFSFKDIEKAKENLKSILNRSFEEISNESYEIWNDKLSCIQIKADEKHKTKFYSNLYRCFVKPTNITDNNCLNFDGDCFVDLATLWDIGKTHLPLLLTLCKDESSHLVNSLINSYKRYGFFPNCVTLTGADINSDLQARALSVNTIYDAYLRGIKGIDWENALECIIGEIQRDANSLFLKNKPVGDYPSHTIDLAVACYSIGSLAKELGHEDIAEKYLKFSENWDIVYDYKTGNVTENGKFYEGCNLNYSFRLLPQMDKRIAVAGGKEKFEKELDDFFGFTKTPAVQCLYYKDLHLMRDGEKRRDFEGFNNETDMETPYCYSFIGRHDKACRIIRSGEKYLYGDKGNGALCGNEDSGALSSLYVANALGLFPCFGQDKIILGSPVINEAVIKLSNGNILEIQVENFDDKNITPKEIYFNGEKKETPFITVKEMMKGGVIKFKM